MIGGDGLLEFQEITQLSLPADLVTLSACDTANGKPEGGEEIDGLAAAFLLAGAKSAVGALWDVEDSAPEALVKHFCAHLAQGQDKASALRQARLHYLQTSANSSPVFWAPFSLIGDGSAPIIF
jgi:CHAT domain-containing protein